MVRKYKLIVDGEEIYSDSGFFNSIIVVIEEEDGMKRRIAYED